MVSRSWCVSREHTEVGASGEATHPDQGAGAGSVSPVPLRQGPPEGSRPDAYQWHHRRRTAFRHDLSGHPGTVGGMVAVSRLAWGAAGDLVRLLWRQVGGTGFTVPAPVLALQQSGKAGPVQHVSH